MRYSWWTAGFLFLAAWLQYQLWFGQGGFLELRHIRQMQAAQSVENAELKARNQRLAAEVVDLKHGLEAVEERARHELGMVRAGETFYLIVKGK